jgi:hypothetical protein
MRRIGRSNIGLQTLGHGVECNRAKTTDVRTNIAMVHEPGHPEQWTSLIHDGSVMERSVPTLRLPA